MGTLVGLVPALAWVIKDLRERSMSSDILAVLALVGALATQEFLAGSVISLMLSTGRVLESWAEGQAERQLKSLLERIPRLVHRLDKLGNLEEISVDSISAGDRLLVRAGEIVAADGVLETNATLDESALTGEPLPVVRAAAELVASGVLNAGAPFEYVATSSVAESTYAGIIQLVKSAQARTAPGVRIASKFALGFVPLSIIVAALAWILSGDSHRAVAVLVAATPCPLILAVPIAVVAGLSRAAKHGAVIKGGAILELLGRAEIVLLDKTGTLTHGGPTIGEIATIPGVTANEVLELAASVDQYSPNVIAKTLVKSARDSGLFLSPATDIEEIHGKEISGNVNGARIVVGQLTVSRPQWLTLLHPLIVAVSRNGELIGAIGLSDPLRPESEQMVKDLRSAGVKEIALVTGDKESTAREVADSVGITDVHFGVSAAGKLHITQAAMNRATGTVIVVGDGINDSPALAAADVGVAMGARGASAASEAADVVIVEDSIDRLTHAIVIAKSSRRKAIQAAATGIGLSIVAMMSGALGITSASQGAIAQEVIDVVAILWALTALKENRFN